ncbi:MAG: sel1 repeat family protein [Phenylobacterium sp.]|uniref:tetratricopeptide repeat protein n=1 Tax=Phenylobacterium sp. TaxID=1871053 RepID=UPI001A4C83D0|nr:tetratricopeptide repeat protein [Phenylobacterium sp.]MBL8773535.1 sel1 repeat family protein [Phenylobacterium sp.]
MRPAAAILALALWVAAAPAAAQTSLMAGARPVSAEVDAALARARAGDESSLLRLAEGGAAEAQMFAGLRMAFEPRPAAEAARGCAWLETAAQQRGDAMHFLGEAYQYGKCGPKDLQKAIATFRKAGDMGIPKSRCAEGNLLLETGGDKARAVQLCREGAEAGDRDAQTDLGNFYLMGEVVAQDVALARSWYEKAAAQRQVNAAFVLGQIYWNADGVPRDVRRARELWLLAYEGGRADATFHLGNAAWVLSQRGEKAWDPSGLDEAAEWYAKAAEAGAPSERKEAAERRDLARQLAGVMRKRR